VLEYFSSKKERKKGRKETMKMICAIDDVSPIYLFGLFVWSLCVVVWDNRRKETHI